jgi:hypothetical protein
MAFENQPKTKKVSGTITQFLRRNLFSVRIDNGQTVTAVMPAELLHFAVECKPGLRTPFVDVEVELRKPPRIHRIVSARHGNLT